MCGCIQRSLLGTTCCCCSEVTKTLNWFQPVYHLTPVCAYANKHWQSPTPTCWIHCRVFMLYYYLSYLTFIHLFGINFVFFLSLRGTIFLLMSEHLKELVTSPTAFHYCVTPHTQFQLWWCTWAIHFLLTLLLHVCYHTTHLKTILGVNAACLPLFSQSTYSNTNFSFFKFLTFGY